MKKLCALILALALSSWVYAFYPQQPQLIHGPTVKHTEVEVIWHKDFAEITQVCSGIPAYLFPGVIYGCSHVEPVTTWWGEDKGTVCTIHVLVPKDFNDEFNLTTLGHEFFHCLGAEHG